MVRKIACFLGSMTFFASTAALSLGLGEITLDSGLNQPLDANIELVSTEGVSSRSIKSSLATKEEFEKAGIDRPFYLTRLKFKAVELANGDIAIEVTSKDPITEPFLNFLIELDWPSGRLLREYTLLLDPPVYDNTNQYQAPALAETRPVQEETQARDPSNNQFSTVSQYRVQANDTLWQISKDVRPSSTLSVNQVMMALYEANPQAFIRNNINALKKGAILNVPSAKEIDNYSHQSAVSTVAAQNQQWNDTVAASQPKPQTTSSSSTSSSGGKLSLAAPDELENAVDGARSGQSSQKINQIQAELDASLEATEVLRQENQQLNQNLNQVMERLDKLERLLELKDQELANIQQAAIETSEQPQANEQTSTSSDTKDTSSMESDKDLVSETQEPVTEVEQQDMAESSDSIVDTDTQEQKDKTATTTVDKAPVKRLEEKSFFDDLLETPIYLYIAAGLALLILIGLFIRQRSMKDAGFQEKLVTPSELDETVSMDDEMNIPDIGDDLEDIDDELSDLDTADESDPIAEADIYIAYGKYEQAESLLQSALTQSPENGELVIKLLECYAETKDISKFKAAMEAHPQLLSNEENMEQAKELFVESWPEESFDFSNSEEAGSLDDEFADLEKELAAFESGEEDDFDDGDESPDLDDDDYNFDFEDEEKQVEAENEQEPETSAVDEIDADELKEDDLVANEFEQAEDEMESEASLEHEDDDMDLDLDDLDDENFSFDNISADNDQNDEEFDFDLDDSSLDDELDDDLDAQLDSVESITESDQQTEDDSDLELNLDDLDDEDSLDSLDSLEENDSLEEDESLDDELSLDDIDSTEDDAVTLDETDELADIDSDLETLSENLDHDSDETQSEAEANEELDEELDEDLANEFDFDDIVEADDDQPSNEFAFDEDDLNDDKQEPSEAETQVRDAVTDDLGEFNLDEDSIEDIESDSSSEKEPVISSEEFDVDFDFDDTQEDDIPVGDADAVSTKLDLARAYIDMGDVEGATDILQEVTKEAEGDSLQEAQKLLESIKD